MRKLLFASIFVLLMSFSFSTSADAASATRVYVNGAQVAFDVDPRIEKGVTLVEFRSLFEELNISFTYTSSTKLIRAQYGSTKIQLQLGSKYAFINGKKVSLEIPAKTVNGRTMIPLRFVSESTGAKVLWHSGPREIDVYTEDHNGQIRTPSPSKDALRGTEWGMSKSEVKNIEKADFLYSDKEGYNSSLTFELEKYGLYTELTYFFEYDQLIMAAFDFLPFKDSYDSWDDMTYFHDYLERQASKELGEGYFITDGYTNLYTSWDHSSRKILLVVDDDDLYTSAKLIFYKKEL